MADQDDQIELIETPAENTAEVVVEQVTEQPNELDALKQQLADAQRRADSAEAKASGYETELSGRQDRLRHEIGARFAAEESAATSAKVAATGSLATAKAAFVKAQEEGRYADAADIAEQISDAKLDLRAATYREQQIDAAKKKAEEDATRQTQSADPEEAFLASVSKPSQRWLRGHPEILAKMVTDPRYFAKVASVDNEAYASGIERDSEEYFEFVTEKLGAAEPTAKPARAKPSATATAAPSARRSSGATPTGRTVHLDDIVRRMTPEMNAAAKTSFPALAEEEARKAYARGIVAQKQREPGYLPEFRI